MRKVRIAGERHYPNGKELSPYAGRWVSPLFDNVSAISVGERVSGNTTVVVGEAITRSRGYGVEIA